MKTEEDEAFDELAKRQGAWGGGFPAKRQAAMDKVNSYFDAAYKKMHEDRAKYGTSWEKDGERIDPMSVYKEPAAMDDRQRLEAIVSVICRYLPPDGIPINDAMSEIISLVDPLPAPQPAQEPIGSLSVRHFRGSKAMTNTDFDYTGDLPEGDYELYTAPPQPAQEPDMLTIAYQSGYYDGKQAALAKREWNFCERCGKRTGDLSVIHTCTPPQEKNNG